jgi:hypothetical protein
MPPRRPPKIPSKKAHKYAEIFQMMSESELEVLGQDIALNGQKEPIELEPKTGLIIDGRNRQKACEIVNVIPIYKDWDGKGSLFEHIISKNARRRHSTKSQKAMSASRMANIPHSRKRNEIKDAIPVEQAAALLGVSKTMVIAANKVLEVKIKKLTDAVDTTKISVIAASEIAKITDKKAQLIELNKALEAANPDTVTKKKKKKKKTVINIKNLPAKCKSIETAISNIAATERLKWSEPVAKAITKAVPQHMIVTVLTNLISENYTIKNAGEIKVLLDKYRDDIGKSKE